MFAAVRFFFFLALAFAAGGSTVFAQDVDDLQYKEDYDRLQQIIKISNAAKRAEQMLAFYKGRSNMNIQLRDYADSFFNKDLETILKQQNLALVKRLSQGALTVRPQFAEALLFYGTALKNEKKMDEAILALAKSSVIRSPVQAKAKQLFESAYRTAHNGSLVGSDKLIKKVQAEMK